MEKNIKISNESFIEISDAIVKMKLELKGLEKDLKSIKPISCKYYVTVGHSNIKELVKRTNRNISISLLKGSYKISSDSMIELRRFLIENEIDNYMDGNIHNKHTRNNSLLFNGKNLSLYGLFNDFKVKTKYKESGAFESFSFPVGYNFFGLGEVTLKISDDKRKIQIYENSTFKKQILRRLLIPKLYEMYGKDFLKVLWEKEVVNYYGYSYPI